MMTHNTIRVTVSRDHSSRFYNTLQIIPYKYNSIFDEIERVLNEHWRMQYTIEAVCYR